MRVLQRGKFHDDQSFRLPVALRNGYFATADNIPALVLRDETGVDADLPRLKTTPHISVGRSDEFHQSHRIDFSFGPELYVTHVFPRTLQQILWVHKLSPTKKSNIDMGFERIDIGEGGISNTGRGVSVMQQFVHIISTIVNYAKPVPCDSTQFIRTLLHPGTDGGISFDCT